MQLQGSTYKDHEHTINGDLCICPDSKLSEIFCTGSKFRESKRNGFIVEGMDDCINAWCIKKGI